MRFPALEVQAPTDTAVVELALGGPSERIFSAHVKRPPRATADGSLALIVLHDISVPRRAERFYRVDTARSREMDGTGLGLALVKHALNRHRGRLDIVSELGRGSTFTVTLSVPPDSPKATG